MIDHNPIQQFQKWFFEADERFDESEPNAMSLTTLGIDGFPKSRMVLLKKYTWEGFIFYTNYKSEKAQAIQVNSNVSLLFNWTKSNRMLRVIGKAVKVSEQESVNYFDIRPRGSNLGAWASEQSQIIKSRAFLEERLKYFEQHFKGKDIPKPDYWGGYLVQPKEIEFIENKEEFHFSQSYTLKEDYSWLKTENICFNDY